MNQAVTRNFHILKYLRQVEQRVHNLRDQYFELSKAVQRLNGMDSRYVAGIEMEGREEWYWKIYRKDEDCLNMSFVFDDRFERDLKSSGRDRRIREEEIATTQHQLRVEPPSVIQEANTFLEEDESNRESEEEGELPSILNRTEYEEGKRLIEEKKLNELSQQQQQQFETEEANESSILASHYTIGEDDEESESRTAELDKELEEFADMELVQIAADQDEQEISANTAEFLARTGEGRSARQDEFTLLQKASIPDSMRVVESERALLINSREVSVVNLPTVARKISSSNVKPDENEDEVKYASEQSERMLKSLDESEIREAVELIMQKQQQPKGMSPKSKLERLFSPICRLYFKNAFYFFHSLVYLKQISKTPFLFPLTSYIGEPPSERKENQEDDADSVSQAAKKELAERIDHPDQDTIEREEEMMTVQVDNFGSVVRKLKYSPESYYSRYDASRQEGGGRELYSRTQKSSEVFNRIASRNMHIYSPSIQSEAYLNFQPHQRAPSNFSGISHLSAASSSLITPSSFEEQLYLKKIVREERTYLSTEQSPFTSPNKKAIALNTRGLHSTSQRKVYLGTRSIAASSHSTVSPQIPLLKGTPSVVKRNLLQF